MRPKESLEVRIEMADMHDDVLLRIATAIEKKHCIEACWLCYACFESRIVRTLEKVSERCPGRTCFQNPRVGIKRRIECLKRLRKQGYVGTEQFDSNTLGQIIAWCRERDKLVHALVTLNNYSGMDKRFLDLAKQGQPLVERIYKETTMFRSAYYGLELLPEFPTSASEKCRLLKSKESDTSIAD